MAATNHSDQTASDASAPVAEGPALEWTVHPVKRKPLVSALVSLFVIAVVVLVRLTMESSTFTVLAGVIMAASLAKFYFPTRYRLDNAGITIKTTTQTLKKEWKLYRSCYPDKNGILLSPFATTSRLENFRGIYLMFQNNKESVTEFCKARIAANPPEATA
jgi:hypothetical protein